MEGRKRFILLMYSLGYLGISIFVQTTVKWYQYFYAPPETNQGGLKVLVPLGFVGFAMIVARIFDSIADPLVAYYSDISKNKRGRRIPFILYGSFPLTLTFILIWFPPIGRESIWNFVYLTVMLSLFFIFFTIVVAPYLALIPEITRTREERINLTMMQGITQVLGVMAAEAGSGIIIRFSGFKTMGITLGLIALGTILLTPAFIKEEPVRETTKRPVGMFSSLKMTLSNRNFIYYLISYLTIWFGINTLTIAMPYISEILLKIPPESSGFLIAGAFVIAVVFSPLLPRITLKYGKKNVMIMTSIMFGFILISTGFFGTLFGQITATVIVLIAGIPLSATFVVPNAIVADIAEWDGIEKGQQREGMFFGTQGLIIKIVIGLSSFVTPLVFKTFGYTGANPLGLQLCGPISGVLVLTGIIFMRRYSLPEE